MSRYTAIIECLNSADEYNKQIHEHHEAARSNEEIKDTLRIKIKNSLENMRSALDYCANDIADFTGSKGKRVYFPYGKKKSTFDGSVNGSLPGLKKSSPIIYQLIASIQGYELNDYWLYNMCIINNDNKHDVLSVYNRVDSRGKMLTIGGRGGIALRDCKNISIGNVQVGNSVIKKAFIPDTNVGMKEIRSLLGSDVELSSVSDWVEFRVDKNNVDVLKLLDKSLSNISMFVDNLYKVVPK